MSIYYNPIKLRARRWIITTFICVPILLAVITYFVGEKKAAEQAELKRQLEAQQKTINLNELL